SDHAVGRFGLARAPARPTRARRPAPPGRATTRRADPRPTARAQPTRLFCRQRVYCTVSVPVWRAAGVSAGGRGGTSPQAGGCRQGGRFAMAADALAAFMNEVQARNAGEREFLQA